MRVLLPVSIVLFSVIAIADSSTKRVVLFQVGQDGNYCVSTTPDAGGCISGVDEAGNTINIMDMFRGKEVVFENVSDAPHDMKFTGENEDHLAAQFPGDGAVNKKLERKDMTNQKINCSFHGDQLAVGYRVPEQGGEAAQAIKGVHNEKIGNQQAIVSRTVQNTGLADVSDQIIRKGDTAELEALVKARPELINALQETRPETAKELIKQGIGITQLVAKENSGSASTNSNLAVAAKTNGLNSNANQNPLDAKQAGLLTAVRNGTLSREKASINSLADLAKSKNLTKTAFNIQIKQITSTQSEDSKDSPRRLTEKDFVGGKIVRTGLGHQNTSVKGKAFINDTEKSRSSAFQKASTFLGLKMIPNIKKLWSHTNQGYLLLVILLMSSLLGGAFFAFGKRRKKDQKTEAQSISTETETETITETEVKKDAA